MDAQYCHWIFPQPEGDSCVKRIMYAKYDYSRKENIVVYHDLLSSQADYLI